MKFPFEFGLCYRSSSKQTRLDDHEIRITRVRGSKSLNSAHQWRPALVAISEDGVSSGHDEGKVQSQNTSSDGRGRCKLKARSFSCPSDGQYFSRRKSVPVFSPTAFAATPFMF